MSFRLVIVLACAHHCGSPATSSRESVYPSFHECFVSGFVHTRGDAKFRCERVPREPRAARDAPTASSQPSNLNSVAALLTEKESRGNAGALNRFGYAGLYQFGAPRLTDLHLYTPGPNESLKRWAGNAGRRWQGSFHIPGHPEVNDIRDFLTNVPAQEEVFKIHLENVRHEINKAGLTKYLGSTIRKVPITMGGIEMMIHLGGVGGARRVLLTQGRRNSADANGTSLLDYARLGATLPKVNSSQEANSGLQAP